MRIFRRNRISERQVRDILQSLPLVQAPTDFEDRLGSALEAQKLEVPHILGSLPRVPAADDFDARLMQAIQDRRRPVPPIVAPVAETALRVNWFNSVAGWVGGAFVVATLAFVVDRSGVMTGEVPASPAPAVRTLPSAAAPMSVPVPSSQAPVVTESSAPASGATSSASTASLESQAAAPGVQAQPAPFSIRSAARTLPAQIIPSHEVDSYAPPVGNREESQKPDEPVRSTQTGHVNEPATLTTPEQAQPSASLPSSAAEAGNTVSVQGEKENTADSVIEGGVVNTGGERGSDDGNTP